MATVPSHQERFAYEVVRRVLNVDVAHVDDNSAAGQFDALITHRDGRTAALEITTVADPRVLEMESFKPVLEVPDAEGIWIFRHPGHVQMRAARRHVPTLVRWCCAVGALGTVVLPDEFKDTVPMRWLRQSRSRLDRIRAKEDVPGRVHLMAEPIGGTSDSHLENLSYWVEEKQLEPWFAENQTKLARSGLEEQHLFLRVHSSAIPYSLYDGLLAPEEDVLADRPEGMGSITDLWLMTDFGRQVTRWSAETGWSTHDFGSIAELRDTEPSRTIAR